MLEADQSAVFGRYSGGRSISGWAFHIIDESLNWGTDNGEGWKAKERRRIPMTDVVVKFNDRCGVGDSPHIGTSSEMRRGAPYVVWMVDCAARYEYHERGWWKGYTVTYRGKSSSFGGHAHYDTFEEADEWYHHLCGTTNTPEQTTLF